MMFLFSRFPVFFVAVTLLASAIPVFGETSRHVRVALMLAVDISSSITAPERKFQRDAYAAALRDPLVQRAVLSPGGVALGYMEWSSPFQQHVVVPVRAVESAAQLEAIAARILALNGPTDAFTGYAGTTALGSALQRAALELARFPGGADQFVIDISGDGRANSGQDVAQVRERLVRTGHVINGLPISGLGMPHNSDEDITLYFSHCVVGGPGSFHIEARGWQDVLEALRAKLILELAGFSNGNRTQIASALNGTGLAVERVIPANQALQLGAETQGPAVDCSTPNGWPASRAR